MTAGARQVAVGVAPAESPVPAWAAGAVRRGGGRVVAPEAAELIVWLAHDDPAGLGRLLAAAPGARLVQLPSAGVEPFLPLMARHPGVTWACAKGVTAEPVAELAVALLLAGRRGVVAAAREGAGALRATAPVAGARVVVVGGGAVGRATCRRLVALGAEVEVVRRSGVALPEAPVRGPGALADAVRGAAGVVLALPLAPGTEGLVGARELESMGPGCWLVNVARGRHVRTGDLVAALRDGTVAGAALDVTDPEPLPPDHPLRSLPNCVVTPHVGYSPALVPALLGERIEANVRRWAGGRSPDGLVDPVAGY